MNNTPFDITSEKNIVNNIINNAKKEVLISKNPVKALEILSGIEQCGLKEEEKNHLYNLLGFIHLENKDYCNAVKMYRLAEENYKAGFCELLQGNVAEAKELLESADDCEPVRWGKCLLGFINLEKCITPTFLQIRNHLEVDIGYLIEADKLNYVENILRYDKSFIAVNLEAYKLISRVMLNYGYYNLARKYLVKSLDVIPEDSETYYFLGRYNYLIGAYKESKQVLEHCLSMNSTYVPARMLLDKIIADSQN